MIRRQMYYDNQAKFLNLIKSSTDQPGFQIREIHGDV